MRLAQSAVLAFSLFAALPAAAFDLTGTWEGSWSCTVFANGTKGKDGNSESTLVVTSLGNGTFRGVIDGTYDVRGIEIADAAKPEKGEIAFLHCPSGDDLTQNDVEFGRLKVSTSGERGTLSGISIWSSYSAHVATCKYKYKRVNTTNPNLTYPCP
jgi:hypothetical protein